MTCHVSSEEERLTYNRRTRVRAPCVAPLYRTRVRAFFHRLLKAYVYALFQQKGGKKGLGDAETAYPKGTCLRSRIEDSGGGWRADKC